MMAHKDLVYAQRGLTGLKFNTFESKGPKVGKTKI
jgi:hypothetical protein